jgi:hypothetical protein
MGVIKRCLILLSVSLGLFSVTAWSQEAALKRVLFVGNSYLYYNDSLHNHVKRMASEAHPGTRPSDFQYKSSTIGGSRLTHHNMDWLLMPGRIGVERPFQVVILQGGSAEPLSEPSRETFKETAKTYADKIRAIGAKPMLYMTHAYVPPHRRADPSMIDLVSKTYIEAGDIAGAEVIPVGLAYARSYKELGACVVYLTLYGGDISELEYDYYGRLPEAEAVYLRRIAQETVTAFGAS